MNKLGFGMMRLPILDPQDPTSFDYDQINEMVDTYYAAGGRYFDTAWMYHNFEGECAVKKTVCERLNRADIKVATKLHASYVNELPDRDAIFNKQLEKTGAQYFDNYLLHGLNFDRYDRCDKYDIFNYAQELKAKGLVKKVGFSYHADAPLLDKILTEHPELEFVQLQINYLDWTSSAIQSRECYEICVKHGKEVIVMEPVKGGILTNLPQEALAVMKELHPDWSPAAWALRFVAGLENVSTVLSGMSTIEQMRENIATLEGFTKLTDEELAVIDRVRGILLAANAIQCTGCSYCTPGCPQNILIPKFFSLYNSVKSEGGKVALVSSRFLYQDISAKFGAVADCLECGQCENICPQGLPIIENLKKVAELFEA